MAPDYQARSPIDNGCVAWDVIYLWVSADHTATPTIRNKTKPVRSSRSVRTGIRLTFLCRPILFSFCSLALLAHSSPTLHTGPTPLGFHHSPSPPPIAMTESLTSGRVLGLARASEEYTRRERVRRTGDGRASFLFLPFFLLHVPVAFEDTVALFDPSFRGRRGFSL